MARRGDDDISCKVFVGGLDRDSDKNELEKTFSYYGAIESVWIATNPDGFGFVMFKDDRDAADAVKELDGTTICGNRCRVEHCHGRRRDRGDRGGRFGGRGGGGGDRYSDRYGGGGGGGRFSGPRSDECYKCGRRGHFAAECRSGDSGGGGRSGGGGGGDRRRRSRSRSRGNRSRSRSASRSPR